MQEVLRHVRAKRRQKVDKFTHTAFENKKRRNSLYQAIYWNLLNVLYDGCQAIFSFNQPTDQPTLPDQKELCLLRSSESWQINLSSRTFVNSLKTDPLRLTNLWCFSEKEPEHPSRIFFFISTSSLLFYQPGLYLHLSSNNHFV